MPPPSCRCSRAGGTSSPGAQPGRYPDFTPHVEYVLELIEATLTRDLPEELQTLAAVDRATSAIKAIVELPETKLGLLLQLLVQNGGRLSERKRVDHFSELTDAEIAGIQSAYSEAFRAPQSWTAR